MNTALVQPSVSICFFILKNPYNLSFTSLCSLKLNQQQARLDSPAAALIKNSSFTQTVRSLDLFFHFLKPLKSLQLFFTCGSVTFLSELLAITVCVFPPSDSEVVYRNRDGHVIKFNFELNETEVILSNSTFVSLLEMFHVFYDYFTVVEFVSSWSKVANVTNF